MQTKGNEKLRKCPNSAKVNVVKSKYTFLINHHCYGQGGINFLPSIWDGTMFWIFDKNSCENTMMF